MSVDIKSNGCTRLGSLMVAYGCLFGIVWGPSKDIGIPSFSFVPGQLQWFRSNILSSQNSLKADRLVTDLPAPGRNRATGIGTLHAKKTN